MAIEFASNNLILGADLSDDVESDWINLNRKEGYSFHVELLGSPNGVLSIETSITGLIATTLTDSPKTITEASTVMYNVTQTNYMLARIKFTRTSGTGTLNAYYSTKEDL